MSFWKHVSRSGPLYSTFSRNILKCCVTQDSTSRHFKMYRGCISADSQHGLIVHRLYTQT